LRSPLGKAIGKLNMLTKVVDAGNCRNIQQVGA
jgi:hypothetical protein